MDKETQEATAVQSAADTTDGSGAKLLEELRKLQLASSVDAAVQPMLSQPSTAQTGTSISVQSQRLLSRLAERKKSEKFQRFVSDLQTVDLKNPYRNNSRKRGFCLLFNQKEFDKETRQSRRDGTDEDANDVELIFTALGFDVGRFNDLTVLGVKDVVNKYAMKDHSSHDLFSVVILSHGTEGRVFARDGALNIEQDFVNPFRGVRCKSLVGKPKLFFIQACRGTKCDPGVTVTDGQERVPQEADILLYHSTTPGYFSWRNSQDGSWFIQSLCYVLQTYVLEYNPESGASPKTLDELITLTNQIVAVKFESNSSREDRSHMKEMPMVVSTLRKAFYFNPLPSK